MIDVYLEIGRKKTAAGAIAWPGWCRIGRSEENALAELAAYGERYGRVLSQTSLDFNPAADVSELVVIERLEGDSTTDFGAPSITPKADEQPVDEIERRRLQDILGACWQAFDTAVSTAEGKELQKGPRGGGRELDAIVDHVFEADRSYLSKLGWKFKADATAGRREKLEQCRAAMLEGVAAAVRGEIAPEGSRGAERWRARYFVRRVTWHILDHLWEIEDRIIPVEHEL